MVRQIVLALLIAAPAGAFAQTPGLPACAAPEHRQFDFWVGEWEAYDPQGQLRGRSLVEPVYDGCGVRENWKGAHESGGSLNMWDRADKVWKQNWIDSTGLRLDFTGGWNGKAMVLTTGGADRRYRMTFTPGADGTVRQHGESSTNQGVSWASDYDFTYRRVKPAS